MSIFPASSFESAGYNAIVQTPWPAWFPRSYKEGRSFPLASVGETLTSGLTGLEIEAGKTNTSAPAAARPFTCCQAMPQILSAPSLRGKLNSTRT